MSAVVYDLGSLGRGVFFETAPTQTGALVTSEKRTREISARRRGEALYVVSQVWSKAEVAVAIWFYEGVYDVVDT